MCGVFWTAWEILLFSWEALSGAVFKPRNATTAHAADSTEKILARVLFKPLWCVREN